MLDRGREVRGRQLKHLQEHDELDVFELTQKLMLEMGGLDIRLRVPLIDIAIPALKQLSLSQYKLFKENLTALIEMDAKIDLLEWSLQKIIFNHLDGQFFRLAHTATRYSHAGQLKKEVGLILSVMAYTGHQDPKEIEAAFNAATKILEFEGVELRAKNEISLLDLDRALQELEKLTPLTKPRLLKACATSILHDQKIFPVEIESLRAFSDAINCPMPPILLQSSLI